MGFRTKQGLILEDRLDIATWFTFPIYIILTVVDECFVKNCGEGECITKEDGTAVCDCNHGYKGNLCDGK